MSPWYRVFAWLVWTCALYGILVVSLDAWTWLVGADGLLITAPARSGAFDGYYALTIVPDSFELRLPSLEMAVRKLLWSMQVSLETVGSLPTNGSHALFSFRLPEGIDPAHMEVYAKLIQRRHPGTMVSLGGGSVCFSCAKVADPAAWKR